MDECSHDPNCRIVFDNLGTISELTEKLRLHSTVFLSDVCIKGETVEALIMKQCEDYYGNVALHIMQCYFAIVGPHITLQSMLPLFSP